jgi:serine/threonine-protein kinase
LPVLAVSSDGKQFVYSTSKGLYLRSVDELTAKLIAGTEGEDTQQPFFSPDGKWIGYFSGGKLKKIAIGGGAPVTLCAVGQLAGASWDTDNTIVYGQVPGDIMRISANGGTPQSVVKMKSGMAALVLPQILPDGKSILYTAATSTTQFSIVVQSLKSGEPKELFAGIGARYLPTGHIVYAVGNNLLAAPFDPGRLETTGGPVPIVEGVFRAVAPQYALSDSGTLAYIPGTSLGAVPSGRTLVWVNRAGKEEPLGAPPGVYAYPKISPDGTRIALTHDIGNGANIWIWGLDRKNLTRLTFDEKGEYQSIWTPDGKRVVFSSGASGTNDVCWKAADGTGKVEKLGSVPGRTLCPWSFSSDGKNLVMAEFMGMKVGIGMMSMEGDHARKPLLQDERFQQSQPKISPDGQWIAYSSNESTGVSMKTDVYVRPFPDVDKGKWQASTGGGNSPLWSPDGRELFYLSDDNSAMAVALETKPTLKLGPPKMLFRGAYVDIRPSNGTPWDISPDGKRFLMMKEPQSMSAAGAPQKINIVLNWFEELKQRVPVK